MKPFWISWRHYYDHYSEFEIHTPWWTTGSGDGFDTICAAVMADNEDAARKQILESYDEPPENPKSLEIWIMPDEGGCKLLPTPFEGLVWRFCNEKPEGWSPYGDRFQEPSWAKWPPDVQP